MFGVNFEALGLNEDCDLDELVLEEPLAVEEVVGTEKMFGIDFEALDLGETVDTEDCDGSLRLAFKEGLNGLDLKGDFA